MSFFFSSYRLFGLVYIPLRLLIIFLFLSLCSMDKASRRARKKKMKYIARIQEVLLKFSDKELESALQVVQAMDAIRGTSEKIVR